jgi:hypothetical protein
MGVPVLAILGSFPGCRQRSDRNVVSVSSCVPVLACFVFCACPCSRRREKRSVNDASRYAMFYRVPIRLSSTFIFASAIRTRVWARTVTARARQMMASCSGWARRLGQRDHRHFRYFCSRFEIMLKKVIGRLPSSTTFEILVGHQTDPYKLQIKAILSLQTCVVQAHQKPTPRIPV